MNTLINSKFRGQIMVLAALLILFTAFIAFSTIGLAWKTQQRIALQHASDAASYSRAVKVARGFNYFGYANRAIASQLTSMVIAHSYHTEISTTIGLYYNLAFTWNNISILEASSWHKCNTGWVVTDAICKAVRKLLDKHSREDCSVVGMITGEAVCLKLAKKASNFDDSVKALDSKFTDIMNGYKTSISAIQLTEQAVGAQLYLEEGGVTSLVNPSDDESLDNKLKYFNSESSGTHYSWLARAENIANLSNASVSGSLFSLANDKDSRIDMTDVANTARPLWVRNRAPTGVGTLFKPLSDKIKSDTKGSCIFAQIPFMGGSSGIFNENPASGWKKLLAVEAWMLDQPDPGQEGQGIYSIDVWDTILCSCKHHSNKKTPTIHGQPFPSSLRTNPATLWSANSGSEHRPDGFKVSVNPVSAFDSIVGMLLGATPHTGPNSNHNLPLSDSMKFMRFNAQKGGTQNQPVNYRSISQNLSLGRQNQRMPWDIYDAGKYSGHIFGLAEKNMTVDFTSRHKANSLSKAVTYYHHPRDWQEPPNFWNPFWRAKLHPWADSEFKKVAGATGGEQGGGSGAISGLDIGFNMSAVFSESEDVVMDGTNEE